uniref:Hypothetical_protein n=1 Tax=Oryza glaberrima TaxID=4538 RepID=G2XLC1_ORYGL|nr:hypothetical_protein [Oryza glaberrima]
MHAGVAQSDASLTANNAAQAPCTLALHGSSAADTRNPSASRAVACVPHVPSPPPNAVDLMPAAAVAHAGTSSPPRSGGDGPDPALGGPDPAADPQPCAAPPRGLPVCCSASSRRRRTAAGDFGPAAAIPASTQIPAAARW